MKKVSALYPVIAAALAAVSLTGCAKDDPNSLGSRIGRFLGFGDNTDDVARGYLYTDRAALQEATPPPPAPGQQSRPAPSEPREPATTPAPGPTPTPTPTSTPKPRPSVVYKPTPKPPPGSEAVPFGVPVPGKPGFVTSPHSPNAGFIDVSGMAPGTLAKDPYSGKTFRVP